MSIIQSALTNNRNIEQAVKEVTKQLHKDPQFVLFFASTIYDFQQLTAAFVLQYPKAQVVGVTTTGEIGSKGFSTNSLSAQSYATNFGTIQAVLMKDIEKYPIFDRSNLIEKAKEVGIQLQAKNHGTQGLAYVFPVGLKSGEEKMLSVVNSIFQHDGFPIFGGTAGDDAKFAVTYVSVNGEVSSTGGATVFMKPNVDFKIYKENIFESTGHKVKITKADAKKRIVYEINNRPAADVYAEKINVSKQNLGKHLALHPIGRKFNDDFLIASPFEPLENGAISFYCQVYEGATVEILQPKNAVEELQHTVTFFNEYFKTMYGMLGCNCILRKLQFEKENIFPQLNKQLQQFANLSGFSSYGEQLNKSQLNQTLLLIGFGEKR